MKVLLVSVALIASGCAFDTALIPVEGPLSQQRPVPSVRLSADSTLWSTAGRMRIGLPGGVTCAGRWVSTAGVSTTVGGSTLIGQYGTVYIPSFSTTASAGATPGQGLASCPDGSTVIVEFVTNGATRHGYGIAKDSYANVFRMIF